MARRATTAAFRRYWNFYGEQPRYSYVLLTVACAGAGVSAVGGLSLGWTKLGPEANYGDAFTAEPAPLQVRKPVPIAFEKRLLARDAVSSVPTPVANVALEAPSAYKPPVSRTDAGAGVIVARDRSRAGSSGMTLALDEQPEKSASAGKLAFGEGLDVKADPGATAVTSMRPSASSMVPLPLPGPRAMAVPQYGSSEPPPDAEALLLTPKRIFARTDDVANTSSSDPLPLSSPPITSAPPDLQSAAPPQMTAPRQTDAGVEFQVRVKVNGKNAGKIALLIRDADIERPEMAADAISIKAADMLDLLRSRMKAETYQQLITSDASQIYVTLNDLRASGISISFDHQDRLLLTAS